MRRCELPIAVLAAPPVAGFPEASNRRIDGVRSQRAAKSLGPPLMTVDQIANEPVIWIFRCAGHATVVGQRKEDRRARRRDNG